MRSKRIKLQRLLERTVANGKVYYQPPSTVRMTYPAFRYSLSSIPKRNASNEWYKINLQFDGTYIYTKPDDTTVFDLAKITGFELVQTYKNDGLYHAVYRITI